MPSTHHSHGHSPVRRRATTAVAAPSARAGGLTIVLLWLAAAVLLFEEWFWAKSTRAIARLVGMAHLSAAESWVRRRNPTQALTLFVVPLLVIYPFKVLTLIAIAHGNIALGTGAFVAAKLLATAVFARLYELTERAIVEFAWIRFARTKFLQARVFIHAWLDARPVYSRARALIRGQTARLAYRYRAAYRLQGQRRSVRIDAIEH